MEGGTTVSQDVPAPSLQPVLGPWPQRMTNPIRPYDWGSTTALARLQGRAPTGEPEAELWMGAHPSDPSSLAGLGGVVQPLDRLLELAPEALLGAGVMTRFGHRLPFLLKVLAIAKPLSLQVHPDAERAGRHWAAEHADGDTGDPSTGDPNTRYQYVDPYAKPELLYALEPVDAMSGFRDTHEAVRLVRLLGCPALEPVLQALTRPAHPHHCVEDAFAVLVRWPDDGRKELVAAVAGRARRLLGLDGISAVSPADDDTDSHADDDIAPEAPAELSEDDARTLTWTVRLADLHPSDPLVAAPLLLHVVRLAPGETLFIPAGAPHAYLHGVGVEIMANSDNVLRAGLTHKEIAVEELLHVIDGSTRPVRDLPATPLGPHEVAWRPPVEEFQLTRIRLPDSVPTAACPNLGGPQVFLCTAGTVAVATSSYAVALRAGESAFVGASGDPVTMSGPGELFRAAVGDPLS